jgi:hypothetical protein
MCVHNRPEIVLGDKQIASWLLAQYRRHLDLVLGNLDASRAGGICCRGSGGFSRPSVFPAYCAGVGITLLLRLAMIQTELVCRLCSSKLHMSAELYDANKQF